ncbi:uncharacterized protein HKW66_Vig0077920 [Vigna angularis]|uniref:Uncharacterized protein n=1 Tax=Phaseolus angularis TaxID=3914 RepID=A0A8T0K8E4_PHAAN|nr:uncharacterized protein HKW66_Vig0077920 [Vigna angularis]
MEQEGFSTSLCSWSSQLCRHSPPPPPAPLDIPSSPDIPFFNEYPMGQPSAVHNLPQVTSSGTVIANPDDNTADEVEKYLVEIVTPGMFFVEQAQTPFRNPENKIQNLFDCTPLLPRASSQEQERPSRPSAFAAPPLCLYCAIDGSSKLVVRARRRTLDWV